MFDKIQLEIDLEEAPEYVEIVQQRLALLNEELELKKAEETRIAEDLKLLSSKITQLRTFLERLNSGPSIKGFIFPTIRTIDETISSIYIGKTAVNEKRINGYHAEWSVWGKVEYILRKNHGTPLSKAEIVEKIGQLDTRVANLQGKRKRQFAVSVSSCLTTKHRYGKLKAVFSNQDYNKYYIE